MFERPDQVGEPLYVICPVFNPNRFRSRWRLHLDFEKRCEEAGAILYTIEAAFGDRAHAVTAADNPRHIQLRTGSQIWLKENLINAAVARLPASAKYIAWVDGDVTFSRSDWANETVHQLQHYDFVQMWSDMLDLGSEYEQVGSIKSIMWNWRNGKLRGIEHKKSGEYCAPTPGAPQYPGAPGLAWACTREAWDALGGLIDWGVLGAGDSYMAFALMGALPSTLRRKFHCGYTDPMHAWQERAERFIRRNVGYVPGLVLHHWHGPKLQRKYGSREDILVRHQFNPAVDLKRDAQGLYQLSDLHTERSMGLRDDIRDYFNQRNEDSLSV